MKHQPLQVGGVPEHFNMPWHWAFQNNYFAEEGVDIVWRDYPGGTGAMMQDIREGSLDVAAALTEGVVAEIVNRQSCYIVQYFVTSPLRWGIHVSAQARYQRVEDLREGVFAISRWGSGSHLMAYVLAQHHGWPTDRLKFAVVGNLDGAREALAADTADGFLWEKVTTQPWVDTGEFRRVGVVDTPWPCFVVAVRSSLLEDERIGKMLNVLHRAVITLREHPDAPTLIAQKYSLSRSEVQAWWKMTHWATDQGVERDVLVNVMQTLKSLSVIDTIPSPEQLCGDGCKLT